MEKAVLISIQPKYAQAIASGAKTIEVRKTRPKLQTPFKCYIYCTKDNTDIVPSKIWWKADKTGFQHILNGKVIGEFICSEIDTYEIEGYDSTNKYYQSISKVYYDEDGDSLSCLQVSNDMEREEQQKSYLLKKSQLTFDEIGQYVCGKKEFNFYIFFGWHITDLVIYDTPRKLSEYRRAGGKPITRAPQSWCYVEG